MVTWCSTQHNTVITPNQISETTIDEKDLEQIQQETEKMKLIELAKNEILGSLIKKGIDEDSVKSWENTISLEINSYLPRQNKDSDSLYKAVIWTYKLEESSDSRSRIWITTEKEQTLPGSNRKILPDLDWYNCADIKEISDASILSFIDSEIYKWWKDTMNCYNFYSN